MSNKWYSNKLTAEQAETLQKLYAKITDVQNNTVHSRNILAIKFNLRFEDNWSACYLLDGAGEVRQLLNRTHSERVANLEGKVVEVYLTHSALKRVAAISVNENLV